MKRSGDKQDPAGKDAPGEQQKEESAKKMYPESKDNLKAYRAKLSAHNERRERIKKIKEEIRKGTYETEEKLSAAVDRLIDDVIRKRST